MPGREARAAVPENLSTRSPDEALKVERDRLADCAKVADAAEKRMNEAETAKDVVMAKLTAYRASIRDELSERDRERAILEKGAASGKVHLEYFSMIADAVSARAHHIAARAAQPLRRAAAAAECPGAPESDERGGRRVG